MHKGARPGLAPIQVARCDPGRFDAGDLGFRIAPRINAAGRLYRADAGVELMLTEDPERAGQDRGRARRSQHRAPQHRARGARRAQRQLAGMPGRPPDRPRGEDWHPGVIGIVASRIVFDATWRPTIMIALDGEALEGSAPRSPASTWSRRWAPAAAAAALRRPRRGRPPGDRGFQRGGVAAATSSPLAVQASLSPISSCACSAPSSASAATESGSSSPSSSRRSPPSAPEIPAAAARPGGADLRQRRRLLGHHGVAFQVERALARPGRCLPRRLDPEDRGAGRPLGSVDRWNGADVQPRLVVEDFERLPAAPESTTSAVSGAGSGGPLFTAEIEAPLTRRSSRP